MNGLSMTIMKITLSRGRNDDVPDDTVMTRPASLWGLVDSLPVRIRHSSRARRLMLRIDPRERCVVLVVPPGISAVHARDFALKNQGWMECKLAALPHSAPFQDGSSVPILGHDHTIRHSPDARRGVWHENGIVFISGREEHLSRRLTDWLKILARQEISARAYPLAKQVGRPIRRITIRDTASRWGSCSSRGDLSFSWRLVLAPESVLHYVVAHEVAHLCEAHHGPAFWALTASLFPEAATARNWLKRTGNDLMGYGNS